MSTVPNKADGFTLLEIMLAVAVLGLVVISVYRFVETTLAGVRTTEVEFREQALTASFGSFLRSQMEGLPVRLGAITGEPHVFNNIPSDELQWIANPGFGTMTRHANGEYRVTLTVQEPKGGGPLELGLRRQDIDNKAEATWFPLMKDVKGLEVRYFDSRAREWMEKWTDLAVRPTLIRVKLWRGASPDPHEMVLLVPYAASSTQMPTLNFGAGGSGGNGRRVRGVTISGMTGTPQPRPGSPNFQGRPPQGQGNRPPQAPPRQGQQGQPNAPRR